MLLVDGLNQVADGGDSVDGVDGVDGCDGADGAGLCSWLGY